MPFDLQPRLEGPLVTLRPLLPTDHDRVFAVASDPLIWEQHPDKTRCEPDGFRAFFQQALDSGGALLALDTVSGQVIGSSRYHGYDEAAGEVEKIGGARTGTRTDPSGRVTLVFEIADAAVPLAP